MDQKNRSFRRIMAKENIAPDREECLRQASRINPVNTLGDRQAVAGIDGNKLGITAAIGEGRDPVAFLPLGDIIAQRGNNP